MRLNWAIGVFLALVLMALLPAAHADSMVAPTQNLLDRLDHVTMPATGLASTTHSLDEGNSGGDDTGGDDGVPETSSLFPLSVLAAGLWFFRKRLVPQPR